MAHLSFGREDHLLLSALIPFDQNNCHPHRYHQVCHLRLRRRHSPSHQRLSDFRKVTEDFRISFFLKKEEKKPPSASPVRKITHNHPHIHCCSATDIGTLTPEKKKKLDLACAGSSKIRGGCAARLPRLIFPSVLKGNKIYESLMTIDRSSARFVKCRHFPAVWF